MQSHRPFSVRQRCVCCLRCMYRSLPSVCLLFGSNKLPIYKNWNINKNLDIFWKAKIYWTSSKAAAIFSLRLFSPYSLLLFLPPLFFQLVSSVSLDVISSSLPSSPLSSPLSFSVCCSLLPLPLAPQPLGCVLSSFLSLSIFSFGVFLCYCCYCSCCYLSLPFAALLP